MLMAQPALAPNESGKLGLDVFKLDDVDREGRQPFSLGQEPEVLCRAAAQSLDGDVDVRVFGEVSRFENRAPLVDSNGGVMSDDHGDYRIGVLFRLRPEPAPAFGSPLITSRQPGAG
jgi:hypothetical protein